MNKFLRFSIIISFLWNLTLLFGVVVNWSFVLSRAAGGEFETFPAGIRILYLIQTLLVVFQFQIWNKAIQGKTIKPNWLINVFFVISIFGIIAQLISQSPNERWNAIPAAFIAYGFWQAKNKARSARI